MPLYSIPGTGPQGPTGPTGPTGPVATPNQGTATLNFGAAPGGQFATVVVTGQTGIVSGSLPKALMMADTTADNTSYTHSFVPFNLVCGNIVVGVGFTIYAYSPWNVSNTFTVRWNWT